MATILYIGTHGTDDPTRASFPFFFARGAIEAGHQPGIILTMDAVLLIKDSIAQNIQGVGIPPLKDLVAHAVAHKVPISV